MRSTAACTQGIMLFSAAARIRIGRGGELPENARTDIRRSIRKIGTGMKRLIMESRTICSDGVLTGEGREELMTFREEIQKADGLK